MHRLLKPITLWVAGVAMSAIMPAGWRPVQAETLVLNPQQSPGSYFLVVTDTAGLLGFVGHRHAMLADNWQAELVLDTAELSAASIAVTVQTDSWTLDSERAYRLAEIDRPIPPERDRLATYERILGPEVLNVVDNPAISFRSESVAVIAEEGDSSTLTVAGLLQLRADLLPPAPVEVAVSMERDLDKFVFTGTADVLQSEFGIRPFSLAGVMRVRDRIRLVWRLELTLGEVVTSQ